MNDRLVDVGTGTMRWSRHSPRGDRPVLGLVVFALVVTGCCVPAGSAWSQSRQSIEIRGQRQSLYLYGSPQSDPVIVSSGDGGWIHLGPHVAEFLSTHGFFVIGFDVKAYLSGFTTAHTTLRSDEEPGDYRVLTQFVRQTTGKRPILIGVSEGAGLSVLAATAPATKADIVGVIGLGLPDVNELGWRWKDILTYLTHQAPNEPSFRVAAIIDRLTPLPLAAIHSAHDAFVPVAEVERILQRASDPKRLWIVNASDHRFSDNLDEFDRQLIDAIGWVKQRSPR